MAKSNFKKLTSIKDTEGGNFGNYDEANGGGSPKGGVWGGRNGRVGWDERQKTGELKQGDHRTKQPRTSDGRYTYASVNGKETKYESRGKTVNPLLTGGVNGIKIEDAKKQFADKKGSLYDKYKDKWYQRGSELITKDGRKYKVMLSQNDIWEIARISFDIKSGAFTMENENFDLAKQGRRSKAEKQGIAQARNAKQETFVPAQGGGIQQKAGMGPGQQLSTGMPFTLNPAIISKFRKKQQLQQAVAGGYPMAGAPTPSAPTNGIANQLVGGKGASYNLSSGLLGTLKSFVAQNAAQSVPQQQGAAKPKVSLGGFFNKKKI